jgi:hypothetical protein
MSGQCFRWLAWGPANRAPLDKDSYTSQLPQVDAGGGKITARAIRPRRGGPASGDAADTIGKSRLVWPSIIDFRNRAGTFPDEAKIELTEQELSRVTGGGKKSEKPREFIKITMSDIIVSHY